MFDKRLLSLVPGAMTFIVASVIAKEVALLCNIAIMSMIGNVLAAFVDGTFSAVVGSTSASAALTTLLALELPDGGTVSTTLALLIIAVVIRAIAVYLAQRAGDHAALMAKKKVRQAVYDKLASMGPAYAEQVSTAEAVQTSVEGAQQLEVYFGGYMPQLFYSVLAPVTLFLFLVWKAGLASTVLLIMVPILPVSIMLVMRNAKAAASEYWDSYVDLGGSFLEAVQGLTTLKVFQADEAWHEKMNDEAEGLRGATMKLLKVQLRSIMVMDLVAYGGAALGIIIAIVQLSQGSIEFSAAFLVVYLSQEFFLPMRRLGSLFHTAMNGLAAADTMYEILDAPIPERGQAELDGAGDVTFEDVSYAYGEQEVVSHVDFTVPHGSLTAVVGPSGSGKSTIAGIIGGRKENYTGRVCIGGVELKDATTASLMDTVTLVPTNGHVFEGTVRSNLQMAAPDATDEQMWDALERCCLDVFVLASGGLDMKITEDGSNLSGGQRQRLCVARALLHDTPIYVFDEATSNVDVESERAIAQAIQGLAGERTVIVVAHRLASVKNADQLLVVDGGRIVERGTHAQLVSAGGTYAALWESQSTLAAYTDARVGEAAGIAGTSEVSVDDARAEAAAEAAAAGEKAAAAAAAATDAPQHRSGFSIMMRMLKLVSPLAKYLLLAILLGSVGSLAATFVTTFGGFGLMSALGEEVGVGLALACVLVAICGIARGPLHYGEQLSNHYIAFRILAHVRDLVFGALRKLAPAKLEGRDKGDLVSLVTSDIELLEVFYAHTISPIAIALVTSVVMLIFFACRSWAIALVALIAYLVLGVVLPIVSSKLSGDAGRKSRDGAGAISAYVLEGLHGISETIQYGRCDERSRGLEERTDATNAAEDDLNRRSAAVEGISDALILLFAFVMLGVALCQVLTGELAFADAFVCTFAFLSSFGPVLAVARLGTSLQSTLASGARVLDLLDEKPETPEVADGVDIVFDGAETSHVGFAYTEGGERILDDVSVAFPAGQMVCITGRSGSGKSTLLKLLMRFWDVSEGSVSVSGEDVRHLNTSSLRDAEGYMTQETSLFVGTIGENLRIAKADATDEELDQACEAAALTELIERLPRGYDTPVGELGETLSGGERQRIGLARIFLHDAPFILLDEPTSNLDALNEASVMRAVDQRRAGKTVVLVSHRASTCAFADSFYSVEHGRLS